MAAHSCSTQAAHSTEIPIWRRDRNSPYHGSWPACKASLHSIIPTSSGGGLNQDTCLNISKLSVTLTVWHWKDDRKFNWGRKRAHSPRSPCQSKPITIVLTSELSGRASYWVEVPRFFWRQHAYKHWQDILLLRVSKSLQLNTRRLGRMCSH